MFRLASTLRIEGVPCFRLFCVDKCLSRTRQILVTYDVNVPTLIMPRWLFILLTILTFGLFALWFYLERWLYRNCKRCWYEPFSSSPPSREVRPRITCTTQHGWIHCTTLAWALLRA